MLKRGVLLKAVAIHHWKENVSVAGSVMLTSSLHLCVESGFGFLAQAGVIWTRRQDLGGGGSSVESKNTKQRERYS